MNNEENIKESFNEIKIIKPKPVRLCPPKKKKKYLSSSTQDYQGQLGKHRKFQKRSALPTSSSNSNSNKNQKTKIINLDNISIEEINQDFCRYGEFLEEEICQNELFNILYSPKNNNNDSEDENIPKIKRCKNPYIKNLENMKDSDLNRMINELHSLKLTQADK